MRSLLTSGCARLALTAELHKPRILIVWTRFELPEIMITAVSVPEIASFLKRADIFTVLLRISLIAACDSELLFSTQLKIAELSASREKLSVLLGETLSSMS